MTFEYFFFFHISMLLISISPPSLTAVAAASYLPLLHLLLLLRLRLSAASSPSVRPLRLSAGVWPSSLGSAFCSKTPASPSLSVGTPAHLSLRGEGKGMKGSCWWLIIKVIN